MTSLNRWKFKSTENTVKMRCRAPSTITGWIIQVERFSWKYLKALGELCISYGVTPLYHLDSDWTRGVKYFRELPKGKCILGLDGKTDIFKAKEIIGNHCCIMGDVPASLLSFGKSEDVDEYCKKLITEVGPTGYIMSSGCDAPYNAKLENLKVMADSVFKYSAR
jgi:uroporphyrinogen-III decarboxylase